MIFVGIDVAKDKHDCFITNTDGEVLFKSFTISNNLDGFDELYHKIESVMEDVSKVKVGLEATGHYSYNPVSYTHLDVYKRQDHIHHCLKGFQEQFIGYIFLIDLEPLIDIHQMRGCKQPRLLSCRCQNG